MRLPLKQIPVSGSETNSLIEDINNNLIANNLKNIDAEQIVRICNHFYRAIHLLEEINNNFELEEFDTNEEFNIQYRISNFLKTLNKIENEIYNKKFNKKF